MTHGILPSPALNEEESELDASQPTPQADKATAPRRSTAPKNRSAPFGHMLGVLLAAYAAWGTIDLPTATAGGYDFMDYLGAILQAGNLVVALPVFIMVLGFLNPGNLIVVPRNHVGKIYQPIGAAGSVQLMAFSLWKRGWKPVMKRQGLGYIPFAILLDIYYFPWPRVPSDQIGYIISNIGSPLKEGFRTAISMELAAYSDVRKFVDEAGELGIQRTILTPGFYGEIDPVGFTVITGDENGIYGYLADPDLNAKQEAGTLNWNDFGTFNGKTKEMFLPTVIKDDEQGLVTILDGESLPGGQLVHRFGGFQDILGMIEGDEANQYSKHIAQSRKIKESLDREAHIRLDIETRRRLLGDDKADEGLTLFTKAEVKRLEDELKGYQPGGANDAVALISAFGKKDDFGDFGMQEAAEWTTLLHQNYNAIDDIFRTGRKFEMHLSQKLLKAALDTKLELHNSFQDLAKYFNEDGKQGPQWDTLKPGRYNLNRFVVDVEAEARKVVPQGQVYVIKSDVGLTGEDITHRRFSFGQIVRPGFRGIWLVPLSPGTYRFNTRFLNAIPVPSSLVTYFYGKGSKALSLTPGEPALDAELGHITTITADGYNNVKLNIDVQVVFPAEAAAIIIATFGSVHDLVKGQLSARLSAFTIETVRKRKLEDLILLQVEVQKEIAVELAAIFNPMEIQVRAVLIQEISGVEEYTGIREEQILAGEQQKLLVAEAAVELARKDQMANAGEAAQAFELAMAKQDVEIADQTQQAIKKLFVEMAGVSGEAADQLRKQLVDGIGVHYLKRAVGDQGATLIKIMQFVKESGVDIVSKVQVGGGEQGTLLDAIIGGYLGKESSLKALDTWSKTREAEKVEARRRRDESQSKRPKDRSADQAGVAAPSSVEAQPTTKPAPEKPDTTTEKK